MTNKPQITLIWKPDVGLSQFESETWKNSNLMEIGMMLNMAFSTRILGQENFLWLLAGD